MRDVIVYAHADGVTYVACDEDGQYWRWPAERGGWARRVRCTEHAADPDREYEPFHATLALRLSGGPA